MKTRHLLSLLAFGVSTILFKRKKPILGTIILTDYCNLSCKHCAVNNINQQMHSYPDIRKKMESFYQDGIRIIFFCGGETLLWTDSGKNVRDLIKEAKKIGFYLVNLVTNGTIDLNLPEADIIFLSLDGNKKPHNLIRGHTYDLIMDNLNLAQNCNICIYMAINKLNYRHVQDVCNLAKVHPKIKAISFNFHTPYAGTEYLNLSLEEKIQTVKTIKQMIKEGLPIFNLQAGLDAYLKNDWHRPCYQCIVSENDQEFICGRCVAIDGLCHECGYLFAVEFSLLCQGNIRAIYQMLRTYVKYV